MLILESGLFFKIISTNRYIYINNKIFEVSDCDSAHTAFLKIKIEFKLLDIKNVKLIKKREPFTISDTLLLIAIGTFHKSIYSIQEKLNYDIHFSYNFPIIYASKLINTFINNIDGLVQHQLISLEKADEFLCIDISDKNAYKEFEKKNRYLITRNSRDVVIKQTSNLEELLHNWSIFCRKKFGTIYNHSILQIYLEVYSQDNFIPLTYLINEEIMAQVLLYHDTIH